MKNCKHEVTATDGRTVQCVGCAAILDQEDPDVRRLVDALYANPPEVIAAANVIRSIELAKIGTRGR
jgi:hypothetical protein